MTWMPLDTWIVIIGALCAVACALPGCFLVLRQMSMMGDAISHAVLPGLAIAFLITGSRASVTMFVGAAVVGILTAVFTQWVSSFGKVDRGASMGIVFTTLFALGLLLIVQAADYVDLDPGCVLYGAIELTPLDTVRLALNHGHALIVTLAIPAGILGGRLYAHLIRNGRSVVLAVAIVMVASLLFAIGSVAVVFASASATPALVQAVFEQTLAVMVFPRVAVVLGVVLLLNLGIIIALFKELRISAFDPELATTMGINATVMHYLLMAIVAVTTVASFEAVGSIIVIAMLIVPAATAYLLTDRLTVMLIISAIVAILSSVSGHLGALTIPLLFGFENTTTSGMMAAAAGALFVLAWLGSPRYGLISRQYRRSQTSCLKSVPGHQHE